jgi:quercetin dioxygenase-like cupin family protein
MAEAEAKNAIVLGAEDIKQTALESFPDPSAGGDVCWKTLISAPKTATDTFTVGIATCAPGKSAGCRGHLKQHRHKQAEIYHVTQGKGVVTIDGKEHSVSKGSVVWIPGDAEHGTENVGDEDLVWLYAFAADGFEEVVYRFDEPGPEKEKAML